MNELWTYTLSVAPIKGAMVTFGFFVISFMLAYNPFRAQRVPSRYMKLFIYVMVGNILWRHVETFWIFDQPLREGLWPVAWTCATITGVCLGGRAHRVDDCGT